MSKKVKNKSKNAKPVSKSKAKKLKGGETFEAGPVGVVTCDIGGCNSGTPKTRCYNDY